MRKGGGAEGECLFSNIPSPILSMTKIPISMRERMVFYQYGNPLEGQGMHSLMQYMHEKYFKKNEQENKQATAKEHIKGIELAMVYQENLRSVPMKKYLDFFF